MSEDPNSYIEDAIGDLKRTLASKNGDYRIDGEFSNFEFVSEVVGGDVVDAILTQIAIKLGRIKGLRSSGQVNNESIQDTYKDLAGYAVILHAYSLYRSGE